MGKWAEVWRFEMPKNRTTGTEDAILFSEQVCAVFDGVSSGIDPNGPKPDIDGLTPGQFAVRTGIEAIVQATENFTSAEVFVEELSRTLATALARHTGNIGNPAYVFAAFLPEHDTIIQVGDCPVMIDGVIHSKELWFDTVKATIRRQLLKWHIARGASEAELIRNDPTKPVMEWITQHVQFKCTNLPIHPFGYGVINGGRVPASHINIIPVPAKAQRILLATDGFPVAVLNHFSDIMIGEMRQLLQEDPLCIRRWPAVRGIQPSGLWPDDATALWLERTK
jgi:hypothetical protein